MRKKFNSSFQIEHLELRRLLSTIYVSAAAPGATQDGTSWSTAFTSLQSALAIATSGTTIEIGQGTYKPTNGTDRTATFQLISGVSVLGGYAGYGTANPDARDITEYPTILSGDIGTIGNTADNSYHVIYAENSNGTLDGFTITGGNVTAISDDGGGIDINGGEPTISNCTFTANTAAENGGAVYANASYAAFINCTFSDNNANSSGGGIYISYNSGDVTITGCAFNDNTAYTGGGMFNSSPANVVGCTFTGNAASSGGAVYGGAVYDDAYPSNSFTNCVFDGNQSTTDNRFAGGGAIYISYNASPTLTNCTFSRNTAVGSGGAVYVYASGAPTLVNCIFWNDTAPYGGNEIGASSTNPSINLNYSDIEGGYAGAGNINANPLFIDPGDDNFQIPAYSPVVDAGDNAAVPAGITTDIAGNNRFQDVATSSHSGLGSVPIVDMGAYEAVPALEASAGGPYKVVAGSSISLTALGASNVAGPLSYSWDLNGDGVFGDAIGPTAVFNSTGYAAGSQVNVTVRLTDGGNNSVLATAAVLVYPAIVYVDVNAIGDNSGLSWASAYTDLASTLAEIISGQTVEVAQGTYTPTSDTDRTATFQLVDGVGIYGGYAGDTTSAPGARDISEYPTILSGDIGVLGNNYDNSYHVVTGSGTDSTAILDGFTITDGNAGSDGSGGGMFNNYGSPTVNNCTFSYNTAPNGGGIFNEYSSPTLTNCIITENTAASYVGSYAGLGGGIDDVGSSPVLTNSVISGNTASKDGGGIINYNYSDPTFIDCTIDGNLASGEGGGIDNSSSNPQLTNCTINGNAASIGGGMENEGSSPVLNNCTISGNTASGKNTALYEGDLNTGGGIDNSSYSSPVLTDCIISGNTAVNNGGGIYNGGEYSGATPTLINCLITGNSANNGGGIENDNGSPTLINCTFSDNAATGIAAVHQGGAINIQSGVATLTNCILWGDSATNGPELHRAGGGAIVSYSDIEGGFAGTGNINANPQFVDPATGDFQLQSTSPAIDAGSNAAVPAGVFTDIAGNSRFVNTRGNGTIVDMGAYEYGLPIRLVNNKINFSQVTVTFSADVATSISAGDLQLTPAGSSTPISAEGVTYDTATSTATFDLPNLAGGIYAASINSISDANGNILSGGFAENLLLVGNDQTLVLPGSNQTYTVQQWTFGSNSSLDIGNNTLIIQYAAGSDPASAIAALIAAGDADGQWNGLGITSSSIATDTPGTTAVGYYDDTTDGQITIRRSWIGDANLDGVINSDDLSLMLLGQTQGGTRWQDGNFNYGTQVNADDWSRFFYAVAYSNGQNISNATVPAAMLPAAAPAFSQAQIASADDLNNLLDS